MPAHLFEIQRTVGEELLAAGWHASSIAATSKIGSAWVLFDPSRRIRVHMRADLAETTAIHMLDAKSPLWTLTVGQAPATALITALRAAPGASAGVTGRDRRAVVRALTGAGMRPDRSRLARALSGTTYWSSPDRDAEATWTAPHRAQVGGWQILTPAVHLDATPDTPAPVLTPFIAAVDRKTEGRNDHAAHNATPHR